MINLFRANLKWLAPLVLVLAFLIGLWLQVAHYGKSRYQAGIAWQKAEQQKADEAARAEREAEKLRLERQSAAELAQARADADSADAAADRLQRQLNQIERRAGDYSSAVGISPSGDNTVLLLADVFRQSLNLNRQLAAYADRARIAGQACERQYDSLTAKPR